MRKRDYKKAYARRLELAERRGLSRSQARGHPKKGEAYASGKVRPAVIDSVLERGLKRLRQGESVSSAARAVGVSRERLSAYAKEMAGAERQGGRWTLNDERLRRVPIIVAGEQTQKIIQVRGFEPAHLIGQHFNEASDALLDHDLYPRFKRRWESVRIKDMSGRWYKVSTDLNEIYLAIHGADKSFEEIYRIVIT